MRASRPLRRALAALLTLSAAASLAAAGWNAREAGTLALYEAVVPDEMTPAALALHIETLLAEQVDSDWLGAEIDAALDAAPRDWARLDALTALSEDRGVALRDETVARLAQAERERLSAAWACVSGAVGMTLPDDPTAIGCYFLTALTPVVGETKDLTVEAVKSFSGLSPDWVTVGLAGVGLGSLALGPASLPARYAVATIKTARRIGGLSARLAGEIAESARAAARFDRAAGPADWIDLAALRPLVEPARAIGEVAIDAGPVAAVRAMRHVDTLTDAPRLARVSAATAAKPGPALEALGLGRIFRPVSRLSRAAVEVWGLAAAALAQLGLAALSLAQWGAGRALRPGRQARA